MFASLRARMVLLFLAFLALISISVAATVWAIDTQTRDALVINLAGRQRMLVQRLVNEALRIEREPAGPARDEAEATAATFAATLQALLEGGPAPPLAPLGEGDQASPPEAAVLPGARDANLRASLEEVAGRWAAFQEHLGVILRADPQSAPFQAALEGMERLSPTLIEQLDAVVGWYEAAAAHKLARLRWIQGSFFVAALALLLVDFWLTRSLVASPLRDLGAAAERIGEGDLRTPVRVRGSREIERVAGSLDLMRGQLRASQEELRAWTGELEARVAQRTRELAALQEVSREITSRLEISDVLSLVTEKARSVLGAEVAVLCQLGPGLDTLRLGAASGAERAIAQTRASVRCPPAEQVLAGQRAEACAGSCGVLADPFRASHLAAPLRVGGRVIGALCVGSAEEGAFSKEAAEVLTELANSAAIALENARLYEQAERVATLEERQRLAAEMHDGLAQTLSYFGLQTEQAAALVQAGRGQDATELLERLRERVDQASDEVRQAIASLQQAAQPPQPLQRHVAALLQELDQGDGPAMALEVEPQTLLLLAADDLEQVVRVVREAVLNAQRHAQAERITVHLKQDGEQAVVEVEDNGRGFDPTHLPEEGARRFGLSIMRARAARLGGRLRVDTAPGQGTRVQMSWPFARGAEPGASREA